MNLHATCVRLGGAGGWINAPAEAGVLLLGPSGIGKSDLALRLIQHGAFLVSDDRTELYVQDCALMARAPPALRGLLEIRGGGIVQMSDAGPSEIKLAVLLERETDIPRLPQLQRFRPSPEFEIPVEMCPPLLRLDPREASAIAKIAAVVADLADSRFLDPGQPLEASMPGRDR